MIDITVNFDDFDIERLIDSTLKFAEKNFPPYFAIPWVEEVGDSPTYSKTVEEEENIEYKNLPVNSDRNYVSELMNEKKMVFFTFSNSNQGDPVGCADGKEYHLLNITIKSCGLDLHLIGQVRIQLA